MNSTILDAREVPNVDQFSAVRAHMVGLSHWTLRRYASQGLLPAVRFGRRILVPIEQLREFVRSGAPRLKQGN